MDTFALGIVGLMVSSILLPISAHLGWDTYSTYRSIKARQREDQRDALLRQQHYQMYRSVHICGPNGENFPNPYA
jgi:hypothetical protein